MSVPSYRSEWHKIGIEKEQKNGDGKTDAIFRLSYTICTFYPHVVVAVAVAAADVMTYWPTISDEDEDCRWRWRWCTIFLLLLLRCCCCCDNDNRLPIIPDEYCTYDAYDESIPLNECNRLSRIFEWYSWVVPIARIVVCCGSFCPYSSRVRIFF